MNKILIIGSNFGYKAYYSILQKINSSYEIHIFSKNIIKKNSY